MLRQKAEWLICPRMLAVVLCFFQPCLAARAFDLIEPQNQTETSTWGDVWSQAAGTLWRLELAWFLGSVLLLGVASWTFITDTDSELHL